MFLENNGASLDFEEMTALAASAISAATGAASAEAIKTRLMRRGEAWPLAELGDQWAPPPRRIRRPPAQYDLTGTYMTINEYAGGWDAWPDGVNSPASLASHILHTHDSGKLLWSLARMNALSSRIGNPSGLVEGYREHLPEEWRPRFDEAMRVKTGGLGRIVAHRQPLLAAMRYVLAADQEEATRTEPASLSTAVMLSHAIGVELDRDHAVEGGNEDPEELFMGLFPRWAARTMIGASMLGANVDTLNYLVRTLSLWRDCGPHLKRYRMEKEPADLLRDATGLELETILGVGMATRAREDEWAPGQVQMKATAGKDDELSQEALDAFVKIVTATPEELGEAFADRTGPWDFFPLQNRPVLRLGDDLIVLDKDFLVERFTTGLYHSVFAHQQDNSPDPKKLPMRWVQAFGEMFELSVEEQIVAMKPDGHGVRTVYTEEDLERAYGEGTHRPDVAVYYGRHLVVFEVVSGRMTIGSRSGGDLEAFARDTEKLVSKKFRQLGDACNTILIDETRLTGEPPTPDLEIVPVVVQADLFPSDALTLELVRKLAKDTGLFGDPRIKEPSIIVPTELDMLEGLYDRRGIEPHVPLQEWKRLPKKISLRDFLVAYKHGPGPRIYRSKRMIERAEAGSAEMQASVAQLVESGRDPSK